MNELTEKTLNIVLEEQFTNALHDAKKYDKFKNTIDEIFKTHREIMTCIFYLENQYEYTDSNVMYKKYKKQADSLFENKQNNRELYNYHINRIELLKDVIEMMKDTTSDYYVSKLMPHHVEMYCLYHRTRVLNHCNIIKSCRCKYCSCSCKQCEIRRGYYDKLLE
jgi:hypothetical protein